VTGAFPQAQTPVEPKHIDELGRQVSAVRAQLAAIPTLTGRLIESIAWSAGVAQVIDHKLGRAIRGWWEVTPADGTARADLAPAHVATVDLSRQVRITPTNTATSHLWVY
jgi:hypothetical protein